MTLRKICTINAISSEKIAKVYRDSEFNEYRVTFHLNEYHHLREADYHTDDKQDALDTAKRWTNENM